MTQRTPDEFQEAAKTNGVTRWDIHSCGFCGYQCGYVIQDGMVGYDSGCDCGCRSGIELRSWEEIADHYNRNQPERNPRISAHWLAETDAIVAASLRRLRR